MEIAIFGCGSIGAIVATYLSEVDIAKQHTIHLIGRQPLMTEIAKNGLIYVPYNAQKESQSILTKGYKTHTDIRQLDKIDVLFFTMKSHGVDLAIKDAFEIIKKNNPIIVITMNGLGIKDLILKQIPKARIVETIANYPSKIEGNVVTNTGGNNTIYMEDSPLAREIVGPLLSAKNLDFRIDPNFRTMQWTKFMMNVGMNAVASIPLLRIGEVLEKETLRKIINQLIKETLSIAAREGIEFKEDMYKLFFTIAAKDPTHRTSTQQDVIAHKPTEVDFFNGYIVRKGKEYGIPTPANDSILILMNIIDGKIK